MLLHLIMLELSLVRSNENEKNVVAFVRAVVDNVRSCFPNVELFQASKIFDPTNFPSSPEKFCTYRDKELELLTMTYSELIDYSKCMIEWDMFKETMRANYKECKFHKLIIELVTDESLYMQYPALSTLAEIVSVYSASTSEVERGFSFQNAIKTKFQNRLSPCHLDQLLRLRLNSPTTNEVSFHKAYQKWMDTKQHRFTLKSLPPVKYDSDSD